MNDRNAGRTLELHANAETIGLNVLMLPKKLDEEVARLHPELMRPTASGAGRRPTVRCG